LAASGIASRRRSEELIAGGLVRVNGRVVREMGTTVSDGDVVEYGGRIVAPAAERTYLVMNKPLGVVTTMHDPEGRRTVADLLHRSAVTGRVVPVGRLDYDTAGVLLLTDDGELAHVLMHPRFGVEKTYRATVRGRLDPRETAALREGVRIAEGRTEGALLRVIAVRSDSSVIDVTVHEGRNRQVRRMFDAVNHPVVDLVRMRFGPIALGDLGLGAVRATTDRELSALHAIASTSKRPAEPD
jgi:23S rRNA pseudouridine2605 synthase